MTIFQSKYGTAKMLFESPIFKKFKGDGCYSYSLLLFKKKKKKNRVVKKGQIVRVK